MSEETKEKAVETKEKEQKSKPSSETKSKLSASELAALAEAEEKASKERLEALKSAAEAAAEEEYQAAAAEAIEVKSEDSFTNKRGNERIFRREMGEPEFFLYKKDRVPQRPLLTPEEEEEISRRVEIPTDQTPRYKPEHILSPEYAGVSNYEEGLNTVREETEAKLTKLQNDPDASPQKLKQIEEDLKTLDYLYENYYDGMNVFRTAKDGRKKIEK